MTQIKMFVAEDGKATFMCPSCGMVRRFHVAHLIHPKKAVKVRCQCGETFPVSFEIRKAYRKSVFLFGEYCRLEKDIRHPYAQMIVEDLSLTGLRFRTAVHHELKEGDIIYLEFPLNDKRKSMIKGTAVVRWVRGKSVGAQFQDLESSSQKALGFYFLP